MAKEKRLSTIALSLKEEFRTIGWASHYLDFILGENLPKTYKIPPNSIVVKFAGGIVFQSDLQDAFEEITNLRAGVSCSMTKGNYLYLTFSPERRKDGYITKTAWTEIRELRERWSRFFTEVKAEPLVFLAATHSNNDFLRFLTRYKII